MERMILLPVLMPVIAGAVLLLVPDRLFGDRRALLRVTGILFVTSALLALCALCGAFGERIALFCIVDDIPVYFAIDGLGRLFAAVVTAIFLLAGFFSFSYMAHEKNEKRYYSFYLITFGVLMGLCSAGNLVTLYLFYELMTLASMPLVLHSGSKEAVMAGLKYLFYSFCGAYMALFGIYFLYRYVDTFDFVAGGSLDLGVLSASGDMGLGLAAVFLMLVGFGVKAGCFPLHAWLVSAHPVAPAPASAFLSGIIVKGGVLAVIRTVFYCVGPAFIAGTWVQTAWIILSVITLLMGSALAFKEKVLKKRFAYSTVSNLSYILLGLAMLNATALTGSLLHVVFHAVIKTALFLFAGALIFTTGRTKVDDFAGLGRRMPVLFGCYTIVSLGLIGIPPTSGIISKWYLAMGSLASRIPVLSWVAPVSLLISALLTAGYLMPICIRGSLHTDGADPEMEKYKDPSLVMLVPMLILAAATLILGIFPSPLIRFVSGIAGASFR